MRLILFCRIFCADLLSVSLKARRIIKHGEWRLLIELKLGFDFHAVGVPQDQKEFSVLCRCLSGGDVVGSCPSAYPTEAARGGLPVGEKASQRDRCTAVTDTRHNLQHVQRDCAGHQKIACLAASASAPRRSVCAKWDAYWKPRYFGGGFMPICVLTRITNVEVVTIKRASERSDKHRSRR
jgi:hypothetical protein